VDDGAGKKRRAPARKTTARDPKGYERAREEAAKRAKADDWREATPAQLVGLYALLHEQVYRVPPAELVDAWKGAVSAARAMLEKEFEGSPVALVEFIRWTWKRERVREQRAIANGGDRSRLGWVLQFKSRALLTDYRVDLARAEEAAKPRRGAR
jgi:hypothetical protein